MIDALIVFSWHRMFGCRCDCAAASPSKRDGAEWCSIRWAFGEWEIALEWRLSIELREGNQWIGRWTWKGSMVGLSARRCLQPSAWKFRVVSISQIVAFEPTVLNVTSGPFANRCRIIQIVCGLVSFRRLANRLTNVYTRALCWKLKTMDSHLIGENGDDKLSRLEQFDHARNQVAIVRCGHIAFEADVREVRLGCNVNGHIATLKSKDETR